MKFILLLLVLYVVTEGIYSVEVDENAEKIDKAVNSFASDLFRQAIKHDEDKNNVFLSPWSVYSALSLALAATEGETNKQMLKGLWLDPIKEKLENPQLYDLLGQWQKRQIPKVDENALNMSSSGVIASLANRAFVDKTFELKKEFVDLLKKSYDTEIGQEDFVTKSEEARQAINQWVQEQTHDKIKDMLSEDMVTAMTRLILVNAVYFKGQWLTKFDKANTMAHDFQCLKAVDKKPVQMMSRDDMFDIAEIKDLKARMLWIPFSDNQTQVVLVLPDEIEGLPDVEKKLFADKDKLFDILKNSEKQHRKILLKMPRLKIESSFNLKDILDKEPFNMVDLFDSNKADFAPMTDHKNLAVSDVVHKALFEVDEDGAKAAASTGVDVESKKLPVEARDEFRVDRPFLALLLSRDQTPLFMGRIICVKE